MKKHIKLIFAIIVGLLVYLYINKMFNASQNIDQDSIQILLTEYHDQIQTETKLAIEEYYSEFGELEISLCESIDTCYETVDTGNLIIKTSGKILAEKGPEELFYTLLFSLNQSGDIKVEDININK